MTLRTPLITVLTIKKQRGCFVSGTGSQDENGSTKGYKNLFHNLMICIF